MDYAEIRPIVLALLANVVTHERDIANGAGRAYGYETWDALARDVLDLEDALFLEVAAYPQRTTFPNGRYGSDPRPTPPQPPNPIRLPDE